MHLRPRPRPRRSLSGVEMEEDIEEITQNERVTTSAEPRRRRPSKPQLGTRTSTHALLSPTSNNRSKSVIKPPDANLKIRMYLENLGKFVPTRVINRYAEEAIAGSSTAIQFEESFQGAVLFADISGFSRLAEDLENNVGRGKAVRRLGLEIGEAMKPIINLILEWGGDVIKFAGDAVFAVFDTTSHSQVETAALSACIVSRKIAQFSLHNPASGVGLSVHCGIGVGSIVGLHVGGVSDRWEYAISGDALDQAIACEGEAERGQVVISPQAAAAVKKLSNTQHISGSSNFILESVAAEKLGRHRETNTRRLQDKLRSMDASALHCLYRLLVPLVPVPVVVSLDKGKGVWVRRVRECATVFLRICGLSQDSVSDVQALHDALRLVEMKMFQYQGATLYRFIVDDKGLTTLWGFSNLSSTQMQGSSYTLNAVFAALDTYQALNQEGLSCAVGITTGHVLFGTVGGVQRCEYTLHGTKVNLSARLMSRVQDGVLVEASTQKVAAKFVHFHNSENISVKGMDQPVAVFKAKRIKDKALTTVNLLRTQPEQPKNKFVEFSGIEEDEEDSPQHHPILTPSGLRSIAQKSFSQSLQDLTLNKGVDLSPLTPFVKNKPTRGILANSTDDERSNHNESDVVPSAAGRSRNWRFWKEKEDDNQIIELLSGKFPEGSRREKKPVGWVRHGGAFSWMGYGNSNNNNNNNNNNNVNKKKARESSSRGGAIAVWCTTTPPDLKITHTISPPTSPTTPSPTNNRKKKKNNRMKPNWSRSSRNETGA